MKSLRLRLNLCCKRFLGYGRCNFALFSWPAWFRANSTNKTSFIRASSHHGSLPHLSEQCSELSAEHSMGLIWQHCEVTGHSLGGASCKISCCSTLDQFTRDSRALVWSWPSFCRWCWRCRRAWWWTPGTSWGWGRSSTSWPGMNTMSDNNSARWPLYSVQSSQNTLRHFNIPQGFREAKSNGLCSKVPADKYKNCLPQGEDNRSFYDYHSEDIEKLNNVSFSEPEYQGKVLLVVNLASFWGYTPQYYALNALTERFADKPFKILGFPCNQFLRQVGNLT